MLPNFMSLKPNKLQLLNDQINGSTHVKDITKSIQFYEKKQPLNLLSKCDKHLSDSLHCHVAKFHVILSN